MGQPTSHELKLAYDQENDTLYVAVGEAKNAVCETLDNGVVIKRDPQTGAVVGLIVLDISHTFASTHPRSIAPGLQAELIAA